MDNQKSLLKRESQAKVMNVIEAEQEEGTIVNILKLLFLVLLTFGLIISMWLISEAIFHQNNNSVYQSYLDAGGLFLGFFIFYVLAFAIAWCWGFRQRDQIKTRVVEEQIARQRALEALATIE